MSKYAWLIIVIFVIIGGTVFYFMWGNATAEPDTVKVINTHVNENNADNVVYREEMKKYQDKYLLAGTNTLTVEENKKEWEFDIPNGWESVAPVQEDKRILPSGGSDNDLLLVGPASMSCREDVKLDEISSDAELDKINDFSRDMQKWSVAPYYVQKIETPYLKGYEVRLNSSGGDAIVHVCLYDKSDSEKYAYLTDISYNPASKFASDFTNVIGSYRLTSDARPVILSDGTNINAITSDNMVPNGWAAAVLDDTADSNTQPHNNLTDDIRISTSDELTNPYTGAKYFIDRDVGSDGCGPNGMTSKCDLVKINSDGTKGLVADLWFPVDSQTPSGEDYVIRKNGAQLYKFTDADTLWLSYGNYDHGGGFSELSRYSLSAGTLNSVVEYTQSEWSGDEGYNIYTYGLVKGSVRLYINNGDSLYDSMFDDPLDLDMGVYLLRGTDTIQKLSFPAGPYSVVIDLTKNDTEDKFSLELNGVDVIIDPDTGAIEYK